MRARSGPFIVAIDGPAGAGKSTAAKRLAGRLGYAFLDTGAIYRTLALVGRRRGIDWDDGSGLGTLAEQLGIVFAPHGGGEMNLNRVLADGEDVTDAIRTPDISDGASRVSAHPPVRAALLGLQRRLAAAGDLVAEGRDMGTVVFPDAPAKFFLTASPAERARRRAQELAASGRPVDLDAVLQEMFARDQRDTTREVSPLRRANDAILIDSESLNAEEVVDRMVGHIDAIRADRLTGGT
jgi:cytidylate kinase